MVKWMAIFLLLPAIAWGQVAYGPPNPLSTIDLVDEFMGGNASGSGDVGNLGWISPTIGNISNVAGESGRPGIRRLSSSTVLNNINSLDLSTATGTTQFLPAEMFEVTYVIRPTTSTLQELRFGVMGQSNAAPPVDGIYLEHNTATDTDWACVTRASSSETRTDINGAAVAAATWYKIVIRRISAAAIEFWLDGTLRCTHTENIPTAGVHAAFHVETLEDTVAKSVDVDFFRLRMYGLVR